MRRVVGNEDTRKQKAAFCFKEHAHTPTTNNQAMLTSAVSNSSRTGLVL